MALKGCLGPIYVFHAALSEDQLRYLQALGPRHSFASSSSPSASALDSSQAPVLVPDPLPSSPGSTFSSPRDDNSLSSPSALLLVEGWQVMWLPHCQGHCKTRARQQLD